MPGSTLNAWPGDERRARCPATTYGILVRLGADAVAGAVHEVVAVARRRRSRARAAASTASHGVPTVAGAHAGLLRVDEHVVRVAHLGGRLADDEHARDVGAVAVASCRRSRRARRRRGSITRSLGSWCGLAAFGAGGDDREVGPLVPGVEHALDELAVHVELACARRTAGRASRAAMASTASAAALERLDLGRVLHHRAAAR